MGLDVAKLQRDGWRGLTALQNDLDVVFHLKGALRDDLLLMRTLVLDTLATFLPAHVRQLDHYTLGTAFIAKMFVTPPTSRATDDAWALITLRGSAHTPQLDLKFVQHIARPFQFSIDSFQIYLDECDLAPLLAKFAPGMSALPAHPLVLVESSSGNVREAARHLRERKIHVTSADEMARVHGGGLLKYCALLGKGYTCDAAVDVERMERYMCNRFFIDFPAQELTWSGAPVQLQRLQDYMDTHLFAHSDPARLAFLRALHRVLLRAGGHNGMPLLEYICSICPAVLVPRQASQPAAVQRRAGRPPMRYSSALQLTIVSDKPANNANSTGSSHQGGKKSKSRRGSASESVRSTTIVVTPVVPLSDESDELRSNASSSSSSSSSEPRSYLADTTNMVLCSVPRIKFVHCSLTHETH